MEIKYGYIQVEPTPEDFLFGDGQLGDKPIQPDGQWDAFLPPDEFQDANGFETYACVSEATNNCEETLEKQEYGDTIDHSDRLLATLSGTGDKKGNDPNTVAECRKKQGYVLESEYPFKADTFNEFYKPVPTAIQVLAKTNVQKNTFGHSWVSNPTPQRMMDALTYSPLSAGVYAWTFDTQTGYAIRPPGALSTHDVEIYGYVLNKYWKCFDSYNNSHKKIAWDFGFDGVKRYTLHRNTPPPAPFLTNLSFGMIDLEVARLQKALTSLNYAVPHAVTSLYGQETRSAVMSFQRDHNINDDGSHFGPKTRLALNIALGIQQSLLGSLLAYITSLFSSV